METVKCGPIGWSPRKDNGADEVRRLLLRFSSSLGKQVFLFYAGLQLIR